MKRLNLLMIGLALTLPALSHAAINKGVIGSPHDFSTNYWAYQYGSHRVCEVCHAVHHTDPNQIAPLWAHATTTNSFIPYNNTPGQVTGTGTQDSSPAAPSGVSLACLSCHDGTVGINQMAGGGMMGSTNGAYYIDPSYVIPDNGNDLHTTHPISILYNTALATADGGLEDPMTYTLGSPKTALTYQTAPVPTAWSGTPLSGQTIDKAMLFNHKVECGSCHDVHKLDGMAPSSGIMARLSGDDAGGKGSLLCRTCHIK